METNKSLSELQREILKLKQENEALSKKNQEQQILTNKEQFYQVLYHQNPYPMYIYDVETLKIIEVNEAASINYGYTKSEFSGLTLREIRPEDDVPSLEKYLSIQKDDYAHSGIWRHKRKNGEVFYVDIISHAISHNEKKARIVTAIDVTLQIKTEEAFTDIEFRLKSFLEDDISGDVILKADGTILHFNHPFLNLLGLTHNEELTGRKIFSFCYDKKTEKELKIIFHKKHTVENYEFRIRKNDGSVITVLSKFAASKHGENEDEIKGYLIDTTKNKIAEESLKEKTEELESFFSIALDMLCITDLNGVFIKVNPAWQQVLGYHVNELEGKSYIQFIHPDDNADANEVLALLKSNNTAINFVNRFRCKDGSYKYIEWKSCPKDNAFYFAARDITKNKRTEEALQRRIFALTQPIDETFNIEFTDLYDLTEIQQLQDAFAEASGLASIITKTDGTPITKPSRFCRLCNDIIRKTEKGLENCYCSDAILGRFNPSGPTIQKCLSGGLWDAGASISIGGKHIANWLVGQIVNEEIDKKEMLKYATEIGADIEEFKKALDEVPVMSAEKFKKYAQLIYLLANALSERAYQNIQQGRFISERIKAEEALKEQEEMLRTLIDAMPDIVCFKDADGKWLKANKYELELFELTDVDYYSKNDSELAKYSDFYTDTFYKSAKSDEIAWQKKVLSRGEEIIEKPDGTKLIFDIIKVPLFNPDGSRKGLVVIGRDITERKKVEKELIKFSHVVEQNPVSIIITDITGNIEYVNPKFCSTSGYTFEEAVGNKPSILKSGKQKKEVYQDLWKTITGGSVWRGDLQNMKKNGELYWESVIISPLMDKNNKINKFIALKEEITHIVKAQEEILFQASILEQVRNAVSVIDQDGTILYWNHIAEILSGYKSTDVVGRNLFAVNLFAISEKEQREIFNIANLKGVWEGELNLLKKDGNTLPIYLAASSLKDKDNTTIGFVGIAIDMSEQKRILSELIDAKESAEESNRLKTSLLGNMNHELRTPMNSIIGFAQILKEEIGDEQLKEFADRIIRSSSRLMNTLNAILILAELESNKLEIKLNEVNLYYEIKMLMKQYESAAQNKNIYLKHEIEDKTLTALLDERLFAQVMKNLVDNAIKYTEEGGVVLKAYTALDRDAKNWVHVEVCDTGIGIPENQISTVFEEFRQASEGFARNYEGTGLGLTLSQRMVELMDGKIFVESKDGAGSTFSIIFPGKNFDRTSVTDNLTSTDKKNIPKNKSISSQTKQLILIVEDNYLNSDILKIFIKDDFNVDVAARGDEAIEMASQKNYDAVLMDINLGTGIDGIDAYKKMKEIEHYKKIPFIAVTGYSTTRDKQIILAEGFNDYLIKPITKADMLASLKKQLKID